MRSENIDRLQKWLEENGYDDPVPEPLTVDDVLILLRDFIKIADLGITEEQFWRLLRLNVEAIMREMPQQKK